MNGPPHPSCTTFLQWALPRLRLRWPGFRKVRRQPCKLIKRRIRELGLEGFGAYRQYLEEQPEEWELLDRFCRITISRFYRGQGVFNTIKDIILPELAQAATASGAPLRCWSAGCAPLPSSACASPRVGCCRRCWPPPLGPAARRA